MRDLFALFEKNQGWNAADTEALRDFAVFIDIEFCNLQFVAHVFGNFVEDGGNHFARPCKMIAPILDEVAKDMGDKLQVAKLNVDEHGEIAQRFGIRGIPTLILFKQGEQVAQQVGAVSKSQLVQFLQKNIG